MRRHCNTRGGSVYGRCSCEGEGEPAPICGRDSPPPCTSWTYTNLVETLNNGRSKPPPVADSLSIRYAYWCATLFNVYTRMISRPHCAGGGRGPGHLRKETRPVERVWERTTSNQGSERRRNEQIGHASRDTTRLFPEWYPPSQGLLSFSVCPSQQTFFSAHRYSVDPMPVLVFDHPKRETSSGVTNRKTAKYIAQSVAIVMVAVVVGMVGVVVVMVHKDDEVGGKDDDDDDNNGGPPDFTSTGKKKTDEYEGGMMER